PAPARRPSPQSLPRDHGEGRCHHRHGHGDAVHQPPHREPAESLRDDTVSDASPVSVDTLNGAGQTGILGILGTCLSYATISWSSSRRSHSYVRPRVALT